MARRAPETAERRIHYYRVDAGLDDDGVPVPVDLDAALRHINELQFTDEGRYLPGDGDTVTCAWVDRLDEPAALRLATIRRSGLPHIEETGNLSPLDIAENQGIAEPIHVVLFNETILGVPSTIAGSEFNFYGPRISRLAFYLSRRAPTGTRRVTFRPLLRNDTREILGRLSDIRLFRLRINRAYVDEIQATNESLGGAFAAASDVGQAEDLEVVLRPRRHSRGRIAEGMLGVARRLAGRDDLREGAINFEVRGFNAETEHVELVDILSDRLIATRRILREGTRSRALDRWATYAAIEDGYTEMRNDLITAASALTLP
jgi:hypothetical protein